MPKTPEQVARDVADALDRVGYLETENDNLREELDALKRRVAEHTLPLATLARFDGVETALTYDPNNPWIVLNLDAGTVTREATRSEPNAANKVYFHQDRVFGDIVYNRA